MDFGYDNTTQDLLKRVSAFMDDEVYPQEELFVEQTRAMARADKWGFPPLIRELRAQARSQDLWNFFLPGPEGAGLTNLQYAPVAEVTGRSIAIGPQAFNCAAPDTGNAEVLSMFGTPEQKERWLKPLLDGEIRSAFAMTEPDVASSDATNVETSIVRDGDDYVINGRKWWITGAMSPDCQLFIVMGKTDPHAVRHQQQSMVIVPRNTPGLRIVRPLQVLGFDDRDHGGHAEIEFVDVRVPASHLISSEGSGFAVAQARLGPGRIHHCMRSIGVAERAIELMCRRASSRTSFGRPLAEQGVVREWVAEARIRVEQLRLLVLKTAWLMDTVGTKGAHTEIQAIKVATPLTVEWIVDKAIQVHGAGGLSQDFPLAEYFVNCRSLRFADGPDEVHRNALGRAELRRQAERAAAATGGPA